MINGSELTTPSRKQQAYTLEFIQTVENEIAKGHDNFFMSVPKSLYLAVNWSFLTANATLPFPSLIAYVSSSTAYANRIPSCLVNL